MALWFPVPDKTNQYTPTTFFNKKQIVSEWTWNPEHDTLFQEATVYDGFHSQQSILENFTNFLDDYFNRATYVSGYLQNNTVPLFLLMQRLYNWTVRVSDVTPTMYNQGFDVLNWKNLQDLSQLYYQGQALHHDIHTTDDSTSWMKQILHIQPEVTEGHVSFDGQDATLTGTVNFKCPYGALDPELIKLIEPFNPGDLEVTEAYVSYCNIHPDNEIYFDREKPSLNFRKSKVVGLARTI